MANFHLDLTRMVEKTKLRVDEVVQKTTFRIFSSIIYVSPVDTGRFRGNWIASDGSYSMETLDVLDLTGNATVKKMEEIVFSIKAGGIVYMVNNLPYAIPIEYGYSQQAPTGVVRTRIASYQEFINSAISGFR